VFAPVALVRAALENAGRAFYLAEKGICVRARIARLMAERLYRAGQLLDLRGIPTAEKAKFKARKDGILAEAIRLGFTVVPKAEPPTLE